MTGSTRPAGAVPRVSIGMPVYNGEAYLEYALRSLLAQTFDDFELVISDNASKDRTGDICRDYAARDARIRYLRRDVNVGFSRNQNGVIELARGEYFLLAHHDDVRAPEYLARTIAVLDADPSLVVSYTKTRDIDAHGNPLPREDPPLRLDSPDLRHRFRDVIRMDHINEAGFGLTRTHVLRVTHLHGPYADSDRVLLAELVLRGRFQRIPEALFFRRAHPHQSTAIAPGRQTRTLWFRPPGASTRVYPHFRQLREYLAAIDRAPIRWRDKAWCVGELARWVKTNRRRLLSDLDYGFRETLRPVYHALIARTK